MRVALKVSRAGRYVQKYWRVVPGVVCGGWRSGLVEHGFTRLARQAKVLSSPFTIRAGAHVGTLSATTHPLRMSSDVYSGNWTVVPKYFDSAKGSDCALSR